MKAVSPAERRVTERSEVDRAGAGLTVGRTEVKKRGAAGLRLVITGNNAASAQAQVVIRTARKLGVENAVVFTGFLPKQVLNSVLSGAAAAIVNKDENEKNLYCFPTKLTDYLSLGVPVIATTVGESARDLEDGISAVLVSPGDPVEHPNFRICELLV